MTHQIQGPFPPPPPPPHMHNANPDQHLGRPSMPHSHFDGPRFNSQTSLSDPQLSGWTIEKPYNAETWEAAQPRQLHLPFEDLKDEISKFRRRQVSIKDTLNTIKSETARNMPNRIVEEQNEILWQTNPTIQWTIASIYVVKDVIKDWPSKQRKKLRRVDVFLRTEPLPMSKVPREFGMTGQDPRQMGRNRPTEQAHRGFQNRGIPPMTGQPPNHYPHDNQNGNGTVPLLPPPPMDHPMQPQVVQPLPAYQAPRQMTGNFPQGNVLPDKHGKQDFRDKQGKLDKHVKHVKHDHHDHHDKHDKLEKSGKLHRQSIEIIRVNDEKESKGKGKGKGARGEVHAKQRIDSDSDSDSDFSFRSVEEGAYGLIERSQSRSRRLSRDHDRNRIVKHRDESRGRYSMDRPPMGKYSMSKDASPRSSSSVIPPQNIFNIRIDNDTERERAVDVTREQYHRDARRSSHSISPTGFYNPFRSRNSSVGDSDTSSYIDSGSSIYSTAGDSVFSEPIMMRKYPHYRSRAPAYLEFDDYPRLRDRGPYYHNSTKPPSPSTWHARPSSRRHSMQVDNRFAASRAPFPRSNSYADGDSRDMRYVHPIPGLIAQSERDPYDMRDLADAVPYVSHKSRRRGGSKGSLHDEWAQRPRYDTRGYPTYGGYRH
ncbi:unnamed protein product [Periconia digitata]|uniref:Uncharacterized protein n=1 Tax=Periconia digitata TaxID=1303443 RepID=A0A9W4XYZ8_9PLEO|nr:unnamed protein product [Periconia digitata]